MVKEHVMVQKHTHTHTLQRKSQTDTKFSTRDLYTRDHTHTPLQQSFPGNCPEE